MSSNQHSEYSSLEEDARLTALRSYEILGSAPEAIFDEFVRLAASMESHALGTLCIIDYVPREFAQAQSEAPQTRSSQVGNSAGGQDAAA